MKKLLFLIALILFIPVINAHARGASQTLSEPTFRDDGSETEFLVIAIGSTTAVSPFDTMITTAPTLRIRSINVKNPSVNYNLYIGSWTGMIITSAAFSINSSSGTMTDYNSSKKYFKYPSAMAGTENVQFMIESNK